MHVKKCKINVKKKVKHVKKCKINMKNVIKHVKTVKKTYKKSNKTLSNAIDIINPSNYERLEHYINKYNYGNSWY